ncbi:MAG: hypothetical protein ACI4JN_09145 [Ruminococcus sp.]
MKKITAVFAAFAALTLFLVPLKAYAAEFVPSIEQKDGPSLIEDDITDENRKLIITPISQSEQAPNNEITENLINAYEELKNTPLDQINSELDSAADELGGYTHEDLVITNVFDLSVINDNNEIISIDSEVCSINIDLGLKEDEPSPIIIFKGKNDNQWIIIDYNSFKRNPDNTITLFLKSTGQIAVLEPDDSRIIIPDTTTEVSGSNGSNDNSTDSGNGGDSLQTTEVKVHSPQTSDPGKPFALIIAGTAAVLAAVYGGKRLYDSKHL